VAVNPSTNMVYIADAASDAVSVMDGSSYAVVATIAVPGTPTGIALNPATNRIYVTDFSANTLTVIDGSTNTVVAQLPVGSNPLGVAYNPVNNDIYISNFGSGSVSVIQGEVAVPEFPVSIPILLASILGLALFTVRKQRRSTQ
jgi:YVTN family beta-propeller protein